MIVFLIFAYALFGFFVYAIVSQTFDWPNPFDIFSSGTDQKDINKFILTMVFWPIWVVVGVLYASYYVIKGLYWFFKNLVIALIDLVKDIMNYINKIIQKR